MREILFRGKRLTDGKWVYGCLIFNYTKGAYHILTNFRYNEKSIENMELYEVKCSSVGQYTGLTANGTKIFEGDILAFCKGATHPIKVYYDGLGWKFLRNGKKIEDAFEINTIDHIKFCEVIGNIHDNPELLGGKE